MKGQNQSTQLVLFESFANWREVPLEAQEGILQFISEMFIDVLEGDESEAASACITTENDDVS